MFERSHVLGSSSEVSFESQGVISRVGQNRIYTPYVTVNSVISLPKIPYIHRIYMVLADLSYKVFERSHVLGSSSEVSFERQRRRLHA